MKDVDQAPPLKAPTNPFPFSSHESEKSDFLDPKHLVVGTDVVIAAYKQEIIVASFLQMPF